jgi:uncharacterized protein
MFVTPLYGGILALWFCLLSLRVMNVRRRVPFGDNGDVDIIRVVRAQGNFAEYVPLALLLMGFLEAGRMSIYVLHGLGIALVVGRLLHGLALSFGVGTRGGRVAGATLTLIVLVIAALLCIYQGVRGQAIWWR